jgi:prepilin-type N-terminal cleavage/methylation domain-containing protein
MYFKNQKGFTLIELLVVVAIISLLSSIVFASLNSARSKAKDASIRESMHQFTNLLELNYSDYGSYSNLQNTWVSTVAQCATTGWNGIYATNARQICVNILTANGGAGGGMHAGDCTASGKFSIMAYLPSKGTYFCSGSSNRTSDIDTGTYASPGCCTNP